jgi:hypothetical protein
MVLKTPRLNIPTRAAFSRVGRWTFRSVVMGRKRIQVSIAILMELVAVWCQCSLRMGMGRRTVEECCGVDAA